MIQIPVYVFTGFLDSGKTKFIQETLEDERFNAGERTLLLVFEEGEEEYDFSTYPHQNVYLEVLDQQTVTTKQLQQLAKKHKAQRIVAELNGMQLVGDLYSRFPEEWVVAQEVMFVLDADHYVDTISTFPFKVKIMGLPIEGISKGDIIVEDDVWIGYRSTILSGVRIGQGAVVAAGAVVTKDVPPYAIVGGVPAKVLKYRFNDELIEELKKVDFSKLSKEDVEKNINNLYKKLEEKEQLSWLPKK